MKQNILLLFSMFAALVSMAQSEKAVKWNYTVKKVSDKTYEVNMTATISGDYHIYAQNVGVDGPAHPAFILVMLREILPEADALSPYH